MNPQIQKLYTISQAPKRNILGLMSGTSLDGLDIALCTFEGAGMATKCTLNRFKTQNYTPETQRFIQEIQAKHTVNLQNLTLLNAYLGRLYAQLIIDALQEWQIAPADVDCIASHGQTIFHAPKHQHLLNEMPHATLQIADADHIAQLTGIITLSDFRQKHVANGGEGAPLVIYGDYLLFSHLTQNRILLNIGGIANFTYLPAKQTQKHATATDTGAGNCLIDAAIQQFFPNQRFDNEGMIAQSGEVNEDLLTILFEHPFFSKRFPKTTGKEVFHLAWVAACQAKSQTTTIKIEDVIATLTFFTAKSIADAIESIPYNNYETVIWISGGGANNKTLINYLTKLLPAYTFEPFVQTGFSPDAKEAILFALLANETLAGQGIAMNHLRAFTMGKISLPF